MTTSTPKPTHGQSPYDLYFAEQKAWMDANPEIKGYTLIKDVEENDDDDDEEEEERPCPSTLTAEEVNSTIRMIMITENREKEMKIAQSELLKDDGSGFPCLNTSFSYAVLDAWARVKRRLLRKNPAQKLDILMMFTSLLHEYDYWMNDNEGGMDIVVKGLASAWKRLLKNDDKALGWDLKYTKPGVMELLEAFKNDIENCESYCELGKFKYM